MKYLQCTECGLMILQKENDYLILLPELLNIPQSLRAKEKPETCPRCKGELKGSIK